MRISTNVLLTILLLRFSLVAQQSSLPQPQLDIPSVSSQAEAGEIGAMVQLGRAYFYGKGAPADVEQGRIWLDRAADKGSIDAEMLLGMAYFSGVKLPKNRALAAKYLLKVAQQPVVEQEFQSSQALARYFTGMMYRYGDGLEKSDKNALDFFQLAADQGSVPAQYDLAVMYDNGIGTPADKTRACQLYETAADAGHIAAMNNAGYCSQQGIGCVKDDSKAIAYYTKAADAGHSKAQNNLAILYGGLEQWERSYFWLRVAELSGAVEDTPAIGRVKAHLTSAQIDTTEKEALRWSETHKQKRD